MTKEQRMREAWKILYADLKQNAEVVKSTPEYDREFDRIQKMDEVKQK